MSHMTCPRCGLATLLRGAPPPIDGCPGCRCRPTAPRVAAPGRDRPAGDVAAPTTSIFATRGVWEPGMDRLVAALDGDPRRLGDHFPGRRPDVSSRPPSSAA